MGLLTTAYVSFMTGLWVELLTQRWRKLIIIIIIITLPLRKRVKRSDTRTAQSPPMKADVPV